jgi:hypothetical protein
LVTQNAALYYYANKENINLTSTNVLYEMLILKNLCRKVYKKIFFLILNLKKLIEKIYVEKCIKRIKKLTLIFAKVISRFFFFIVFTLKFENGIVIILG